MPWAGPQVHLEHHAAKRDSLPFTKCFRNFSLAVGDQVSPCPFYPKPVKQVTTKLDLIFQQVKSPPIQNLRAPVAVGFGHHIRETPQRPQTLEMACASCTSTLPPVDPPPVDPTPGSQWTYESYRCPKSPSLQPRAPPRRQLTEGSPQTLVT